MDLIVVENLELVAAIGVSDAEREVGQRLDVTIEAGYDLHAAGQSDALNDTVSYSELARCAAAVAVSEPCKLLEHLAAKMSHAIFERFPVASVRIRLLKKPPPTELMIARAGVEIFRTRDTG